LVFVTRADREKFSIFVEINLGVGSGFVLDGRIGAFGSTSATIYTGAGVNKALGVAFDNTFNSTNFLTLTTVVTFGGDEMSH